MKIYLYYISRSRDLHSNALAEEYIKRSTRFLKCEMREIHPGRFDPWERHPGARKVMLDPAGRTMDSAKFIAMVDRAGHDGHDLVFVIGGADGLPEPWRARADLLLGLSAMTMPHELARAVLAEQIYRALTTLRGHPYPR